MLAVVVALLSLGSLPMLLPLLPLLLLLLLPLLPATATSMSFAAAAASVAAAAVAVTAAMAIERISDVRTHPCPEEACSLEDVLWVAGLVFSLSILTCSLPAPLARSGEAVAWKQRQL